MARYANGDDAAFSEVYDAVAPRLLAFLTRRTGDARRAEDLVQQTFLQMHCARGRFVPGAAVLPWAFAIARRLLIDDHRRAGRRPDLREPTDAPDPTAASGYEQASANQLAELLAAELDRLPAAQREAFELMRLDGLSLTEAADVTGASVSALKSRAHRAYDTLRCVFAALLGLDE